MQKFMSVQPPHSPPPEPYKIELLPESPIAQVQKSEGPRLKQALKHLIINVPISDSYPKNVERLH